MWGRSRSDAYAIKDLKRRACARARTLARASAASRDPTECWLMARRDVWLRSDMCFKADIVVGLLNRRRVACSRLLGSAEKRSGTKPNYH